MMDIDWKFIRVVDTETELLELILNAHNSAMQTGLNVRSRVYSTGKVRIFDYRDDGRDLVFEAEKRPSGRWRVRSNLWIQE